MKKVQVFAVNYNLTVPKNVKEGHLNQENDFPIRVTI